jgi:hypothetical protein
MRLLLNLMCLIMLQGSPVTSRSGQIANPEIPPKDEVDRKLPNGKSQNEAILKAEYEKTLKEAAQLVELSQSLQTELENNSSHVLSLSSLKKAEEIEKLAKRIHSRLKR